MQQGYSCNLTNADVTSRISANTRVPMMAKFVIIAPKICSFDSVYRTLLSAFFLVIYWGV